MPELMYKSTMKIIDDEADANPDKDEVTKLPKEDSRDLIVIASKTYITP